MNFSGGKQKVSPPLRGVFPLDHAERCKASMKLYIACLKAAGSRHHLCKGESRRYLECRMEANLMSPENLDELGYGEAAEVRGEARDDSGGRRGEVVAGKHIHKRGEGTLWNWGGTG